jgi:hypothetical protein
MKLLKELQDLRAKAKVLKERAAAGIDDLLLQVVLEGEG